MKNTLQRMKTTEYYIGLKYDSKSREWKWISDNSKLNATTGKFPWAEGEPNGDGNCAVMYKDYRQDYGLFNDFSCNYKGQETYRGYICESSTKSADQEGTSYKYNNFYCDFTGPFFFFFSISAPYKLLIEMVTG